MAAGVGHLETLDGLQPASRPPALRVMPAIGEECRMIVACPHSGRYYPPDMLKASALDPLSLRRSEDAFVDGLFEDAPMMGGDLFLSQFARAYVDLNRDCDELDPDLIDGLAPIYSVRLTSRVKAGLGVIPRTVGDDIAIYPRRLSLESALARLKEVYYPWHQAIESSLLGKQAVFGRVLLLDCHSMPDRASGDAGADVILGNRFGASCAPLLSDTAAQFLSEAGLKVVRNDPYPGGYSTIRYGRPNEGRHALQIEINRPLYMVEGAMTKRSCFDDVRQLMANLVSVLAGTIKSL